MASRVNAIVEADASRITFQAWFASDSARAIHLTDSEPKLTFRSAIVTSTHIQVELISCTRDGRSAAWRASSGPTTTLPTTECEVPCSTSVMT